MHVAFEKLIFLLQKFETIIIIIFFWEKIQLFCIKKWFESQCKKKKTEMFLVEMQKTDMSEKWVNMWMSMAKVYGMRFLTL